MTRDVLAGQNAGLMYDPARGVGGLEKAMRTLLAHKDAGTLEEMGANALKVAKGQDWPDFGSIASNQG